LYPNTKAVIKVNSLKALFKGCNLETKPFVTQPLLQKFGLDIQNPPPEYPFDRYLEMLDWLRQQLYTVDSPALGFEKIGRNITNGVFDSAIGQILKGSAELLGPERGMKFFFQKLGGALAFGTLNLLEQKPGYIRFELLNVPGPADVTRGMALAALEAAKVKAPAINFHMRNEYDNEFIATWIPKQSGN
jgi:uncharacterized protein (TIGR02265 family)